MDFSTPFSYPFKDANWLKKLAINGLIALIPIVGGMYLVGWGLEITRQIIKGETVVIPETDFGKYLSRGFKAWVIGLVYAIPTIIFQIPNAIMNAVSQSSGGDNGSGAVMTGLIAITLCTSILNILYSLLLVFVYPAAMANFVANNDELSAGLRFGEIFGLIKKAPVAFLLVWVGSLISGLIAGIGVIACVIGVIVTMAYAILILSHFYGQAYLEATK